MTFKEKSPEVPAERRDDGISSARRSCSSFTAPVKGAFLFFLPAGRSFTVKLVQTQFNFPDFCWLTSS